MILDRDSHHLWLDPGITNVQVVSELLKPYDARMMRCYPVSMRINRSTAWLTTTKNAPHPSSLSRFEIGFSFSKGSIVAQSARTSDFTSVF